jgi:TPR repeat protein
LASLFLEKNNIKKATYWFQRAKDNNHPQAPTALDRLKREQGE